MNIQIEAESECAASLRDRARHLASSYALEGALDATTIGLLAQALEDEVVAQGRNPAKLKFFTTEKEE